MTLNSAQTNEQESITPAPTITLADNPEEAVREIIALTEKLTALMEEEKRAIISSDSIAFMAALGSKEKNAQRYQSAANQFSARMEEFRSVNPTLLQKLEEAQNALGTITRENTSYMKPLNREEK